MHWSESVNPEDVDTSPKMAESSAPLEALCGRSEEQSRVLIDKGWETVGSVLC